MTRQEHVEELAKNLGCRLLQGPALPGMMYVEFGHVEGPTILNQIDYLVMLHELGHFALGHTQGRPPMGHARYYFDHGVLKCEAEAWNWALDHCSEVLEEATRHFMWYTCLGSYLATAIRAAGKPSRLTNGDRHYVEFIYDEPDEFFWAVVYRIKPTNAVVTQLFAQSP